jgi:KTSC domain
MTHIDVGDDNSAPEQNMLRTDGVELTQTLLRGRCPGSWKQKLRPPILPRLIRIQENMQRVPVDSGSIASIGYAPEQQVLELEFRQSGEVYQYFNVPAQEHTAFLAADAKGTYLNHRFKPPQYRYQQIRPQQE